MRVCARTLPRNRAPEPRVAIYTNFPFFPFLGFHSESVLSKYFPFCVRPSGPAAQGQYVLNSLLLMVVLLRTLLINRQQFRSYELSV